MRPSQPEQLTGAHAEADTSYLNFQNRLEQESKNQRKNKKQPTQVPIQQSKVEGAFGIVDPDRLPWAVGWHGESPREKNPPPPPTAKALRRNALDPPPPLQRLQKFLIPRLNLQIVVAP